MSYNDIEEETEKKHEIKLESILDIVSNNYNNDKLKLLIKDLKDYKHILELSKKEDKKLNNEEFRKTLYNILEKMLMKIVYITDKPLREATIDKVYIWYKTNYEKYTKIIQIKEKKRKTKTKIIKREKRSQKRRSRN